GAHAVVAVASVDVERRADGRAVGEQLHDQTRVDAADHLPPCFERRDERTRGEPPHDDRTAARLHTIADRWTIGIGVPRVARILEAEELAVALVAPPIEQGQRTVRLERAGDEPILQRTSANADVVASPEPHRP